MHKLGLMYPITLILLTFGLKPALVNEQNKHSVKI